MDKFIVRYPTGGMMVYVGYFFSHANISSVNKFLMLVKKHCTIEQQAELIRKLEAANQIPRYQTKSKRIEKAIEKIKKHH